MIDEEKTPLERLEIALEEEIEQAWKGLLKQEAGRLILWSILDKCGLFSFPHYGDSTDTLLKGRQQVGSQILADHVFPHGMKYYTDMLLEAEERENRILIAQRQTEEEENDDDA